MISHLSWSDNDNASILPPFQGGIKRGFCADRDQLQGSLGVLIVEALGPDGGKQEGGQGPRSASAGTETFDVVKKLGYWQS